MKNRYKGSSKVAVKPRTTEQISRILAYCNERRIAIVPQESIAPTAPSDESGVCGLGFRGFCVEGVGFGVWPSFQDTASLLPRSLKASPAAAGWQHGTGRWERARL